MSLASLDEKQTEAPLLVAACTENMFCLYEGTYKVLVRIA